MKKLGLVVGLFVMVGCAAESAPADDAVNDESDVVGASSFALLETAFGLSAGEKTAEKLRSGDCYNAFVLPVEGIRTHHVKAYGNGAIVYPADGKPSDSVCVDVYGDKKMSFSHAMLDTIVRFGVGRYEKKVVDPAS